MNCPNGHTATGTVPHPQRTVACPRELLGKTIIIHGIGERRCEDTGGAIKTGRIDLYVGSIPEAYAFGVQERTYSLID